MDPEPGAQYRRVVDQLVHVVSSTRRGRAWMYSLPSDPAVRDSVVLLADLENPALWAALDPVDYLAVDLPWIEE